MQYWERYRLCLSVLKSRGLPGSDYILHSGVFDYGTTKEEQRTLWWRHRVIERMGAEFAHHWNGIGAFPENIFNTCTLTSSTVFEERLEHMKHNAHLKDRFARLIEEGYL